MNKDAVINELINRNDGNVLENLRRCPFSYHWGYVATDTVKTQWPTLNVRLFFASALPVAIDLDSRLLPMWVLEDQFYDEELRQQVDSYDLCLPQLNVYIDESSYNSLFPKTYAQAARFCHEIDYFVGNITTAYIINSTSLSLWVRPEGICEVHWK